ncbi:MAG: hypothetical protein K9L83_08210, partial [Deltaproteobacteria bacterium]|nr:hypothetical protein [Deltaproteobacteria bacterium]
MSIFKRFLIYQTGKPSREDISAVRQAILDRLLYVFSIIGLPAVGIGAFQTYLQGRWIFSLVYVGLYLGFLAAAFGSRWLPYTVRAVVLVSCLYLIAMAVLVRIGLSGVGL